jgi:hypothetical protein
VNPGDRVTTVGQWANVLGTVRQVEPPQEGNDFAEERAFVEFKALSSISRAWIPVAHLTRWKES